MTTAKPARMRTFYVIWFGQLISMIGSGLTSFGLGVWVFQRTGSATEFALIGVAAILPAILIAPLAGPLIDRYDRRRIMLLADLCAGLSTVAVALLLFSGRLELWHIYLSAMASSAAGAFQGPAFSAAIAQLVPKAKLGRAAGLVSGAQGASLIIAPALAGVLIGLAGLPGIILIDFATFLFAVATLLRVRFPAYRHEAADAPAPSLRREIRDGWRYLTSRPGLMGSIVFFTFLNFTWALAGELLTPLILSFAPPEELGAAVALGGLGILAGSAVMAASGGRWPILLMIYGYGFLQAIALVLMGWHESVVLIALVLFVIFMCNPIINGHLQVLLQRKIPPEMHGRVFSTLRMMAMGAMPVAYLLAGPLVDRVFGPLMQTEGALAGSIGLMIGSGPGRGIGLIFVLAGLLTLAGTLVALAYQPLRRIERDLPDALPNPLPVSTAPVDDALTVQG